jgi:sec-independent protein translocase protein TatB
MPGFGDTTFIVLLALLLFGPKKLPVLARQLGKLMADFRRASNEFKIQMEEELRISEQAERQKQIAAMEAAAPKPAEPIPDPEHPHLPPPPNEAEPATSSQAEFQSEWNHPSTWGEPLTPAAEAPAPEPLPIATSGDLNLMPPSTGLPVARGSAAPSAAPEPQPELPTEAPELQTVSEQHAAEPEARPWMI